jgi:hypothetical protein
MTASSIDTAIVVSGLDNESGLGGLFVVGDHRVCQLDDIPTSGLWFDESSRRWVRALHPVFTPVIDGSLLIYGSRGRVRLRPLLDARDLHDVRVVDGQILVVASYDNSIVSPRMGRIDARWRLPGEPDAWHLNCLAARNGELFASAFCRGRTYREWNAREAGAGIVFSLKTGRIVGANLDAPHSPMFVDGALLVCNSAQGQLVKVDPEEPSRHVRVADLGGWTRGLAVVGDRILVGVSVLRRQSTACSEASVHVMDRYSWEVIDRVTVPVSEIYDIRAVDRGAVTLLDQAESRARQIVRDAATKGRGARPVPGYPTPRRTSSGPEHVLERADARLVVNSNLPETLRADVLTEISVRFENRSGRVYPATGAHPVRASYRWTDPNGQAFPAEHEPLRTILPEDVLPDQVAEVVVLVRSPAIPGVYRLRVTLVQEGVFWFDDVNASAAVALDVTVRACSAERHGILRSSWARRLGGARDRLLGGMFGVPERGHRSQEVARHLLAKDEEVHRTARQLLARMRIGSAPPRWCGRLANSWL